jgi:hypothetical protein
MSPSSRKPSQATKERLAGTPAMRWTVGIVALPCDNFVRTNSGTVECFESVCLAVTKDGRRAHRPVRGGVQQRGRLQQTVSCTSVVTSCRTYHSL